MHDFKKRVLDPAIKQINEHTDITVKVEQHKKGRSVSGFSFKFKQKQQPKIEKPIDPKRDPNTPDFFIPMTDSQRHLFAHKLSEMHEMSEYSVGTESYKDFAKRIAEMLLEPEKFRTFYPLLVEIFRSSKGIVDHEFSQEVIDACRADVEARQQRILNGETTFEQEDAALMAEWKKLNSKN